jgi:hypothetical protein
MIGWGIEIYYYIIVNLLLVILFDAFVEVLDEL